MGRAVILGNNGLTVGLNEQGLVHDFYYPYVGLENLTTARSAMHKLGIWVDGQFSWSDDGSWQVSVDFEAEALVGHTNMKNTDLGVEIELIDFVDSKYDAFCRNLKLKNTTTEAKEVRLFFHQVFQISRAGRADTALFVPEASYILDYKGYCSLLIYAQDQDGQPFDQYAVGNYGIENKEGTFKDAEDGELSGSSVEHGGVDSVLRVRRLLEPSAETEVNYWIIAADSQYNAERVHDVLLKDKLHGRLEKTRQHWHDWLAPARSKMASLDVRSQAALSKSLLIIKVHTDKRGATIASCDSSIYNYGRDYYSYFWPRDGAYAMWPLIRLGFKDEPKKFFHFCRDIITKQGYLMHKYQPDKAIGSTWHPLLHNNRQELAIQEDETAIVLQMLGEYYYYSDDKDFVSEMYDSLIKPAADFLAGFIDAQSGLPHASYDLWEEKFLTTTYTTAITHCALVTAAEIAADLERDLDATHWREVAAIIDQNSKQLFNTEKGHYRKGILFKEDDENTFDDTLDMSSLYGPMMFKLGDNEALIETAKQIEEKLLNSCPAGGVPRYEHDNYFLSDMSYLGNPWMITSLWLAQFYVKNHDRDRAHQLVDWVLANQQPSGALPEQVYAENGQPASVNPLVWSHAELVNTILDLSN